MQSEYVTKSEFNAATGCHSHSIVTLDPWLCVPVFQQVCLYIYYIALRLKCQHFVPYFPSFFCLFFPESAILLSVKEKRKHDITGELQICQKFYFGHFQSRTWLFHCTVRLLRFPHEHTAHFTLRCPLLLFPGSRKKCCHSLFGGFRRLSGYLLSAGKRKSVRCALYGNPPYIPINMWTFLKKARHVSWPGLLSPRKVRMLIC